MTFDRVFRMYEMFNTYFKNEADAKALASEIEGLINDKMSFEKADLATKNDIRQLEISVEQGFKDILKG